MDNITSGNNALKIDFSGLFDKMPGDLQKKEEPQKNDPFNLNPGAFSVVREYKSTNTPQNTAESEIAEKNEALTEKLIKQYEEAEEALLRQYDEAEEVYQKSLQVYNTYQDNKKQTEKLQGDILKGLQRAENINTLFLQAVKAISLMTNNSLFYTQAEQDLIAIYGNGLQNEKTLEIELSGINDRINKLERSWNRENDPIIKGRIAAAIRAHKARAEEINRAINA